jgi:hypothetical protein
LLSYFTHGITQTLTKLPGRLAQSLRRTRKGITKSSSYLLNRSTQTLAESALLLLTPTLRAPTLLRVLCHDE